MEVLNDYQIETGRIFLYGDITEKSAKDVILKMRASYYYYVDTVYLYIHTDGGDFEACCSICDEIQGIQNQGGEVVTISVGKTYSSGAFILCMGDRRYATINSTIMFHPISFELGDDFIGNQVKYTAFSDKQFTIFLKTITDKLGKKTKKTREAFRESFKDELWLTAEEAKKQKLIDDIWDYMEEPLEEESE